jgi:hypothetical protein
MPKVISKAVKAVKKAPVPSLIVAGTGETVVREGPKGLKTDAGVLAGVEAARKAFTHPIAKAAGRQVLTKGVVPLAVASGTADIAETAYEAGATVRAKREAAKEKRGSEKKYGTVAAATATRKKRQRRQAIARDVREQRNRLIDQGSLPEGAVARYTDEQIIREYERGKDAANPDWLKKASGKPYVIYKKAKRLKTTK